MWSLIIVLVLCLNASVHTHWFEQSDLCVTWKGTKGICRHYLNCPTAAEGVQADGPLEICDFEGIYPIVCCEFDNSVISAPLILGTPDYSITGTTPNLPPFNDYSYSAIASGRNAEGREFVYMALLGYGERNNVQWLCGGSLISKQFVLTAAHCLNSSSYGELRYIRLGELDYSTTIDDADPQDFTVRSTHPYPRYTRFSYYYDIALVRLDRPVTYSDYVNRACLGLTKDLTGRTAMALGWGATSDGGIGSTTLQVARLSFVSHEICRAIYGKEPHYQMGIMDETQVCADGGYIHADTCPGDSGGPLEIKNFRDNCPEIVAISSFGKRCGLGADVYTRVYPYYSWIKAVVKSVK